MERDVVEAIEIDDDVELVSQRRQVGDGHCLLRLLVASRGGVQRDERLAVEPRELLQSRDQVGQTLFGEHVRERAPNDCDDDMLVGGRPWAEGVVARAVPRNEADVGMENLVLDPARPHRHEAATGGERVPLRLETISGEHASRHHRAGRPGHDLDGAQGERHHQRRKQPLLPAREVVTARLQNTAYFKTTCR